MDPLIAKMISLLALQIDLLKAIQDGSPVQTEELATTTAAIAKMVHERPIDPKRRRALAELFSVCSVSNTKIVESLEVGGPRHWAL